jgi:hypothetical protein
MNNVERVINKNQHLMKYFTFLICAFIGLIRSSSAQSTSFDILWYVSKTTCSDGFAYKGRIIVSDDCIDIYIFNKNSQEHVSKFVVISQRPKWKIANYTGFSNYKVIQLLDSTRRNIKLSLKNGLGRIEVSDGKYDFTLLVSRYNSP